MTTTPIKVFRFADELLRDLGYDHHTHSGANLTDDLVKAVRGVIISTSVSVSEHTPSLIIQRDPLPPLLNVPEGFTGFARQEHIAHMLGHFFLHDEPQHPDRFYCHRQIDRRLEEQANMFATAILAPWFAVRHALSHGETPEQLASVLQVPVTRVRESAARMSASPLDKHPRLQHQL